MRAVEQPQKDSTPSTHTSTQAILRKGSKGASVASMQSMLIALGYSCGVDGADGDFGTNTYNALRAFQNANGLEVDGEYGPLSSAKLTALYNARSSNNHDESYLVRVLIDDLNIRKGAGVDCALVGKFTGKGVFTIVEEKTGKIDNKGSVGKWGLLKSYKENKDGWICLAYDSYTKKL